MYFASVAASSSCRTLSRDMTIDGPRTLMLAAAVLTALNRDQLDQCLLLVCRPLPAVRVCSRWPASPSSSSS